MAALGVLGLRKRERLKVGTIQMREEGKDRPLTRHGRSRPGGDDHGSVDGDTDMEVEFPDKGRGVTEECGEWTDGRHAGEGP